MQAFERAAQGEITPAVFHMLLLIEENPGVSMSAIASAHGIDRASLMPAIQRMESAGWIERITSPEDKRVLMLRCTSAGSALNRNMLTKVRAIESALLDDLSADEQRTLLSLLKRVVDGSKQKRAARGKDAPAKTARGGARSNARA
jgi:DNA-binding MarR family transcriptional regulator